MSVRKSKHHSPVSSAELVHHTAAGCVLCVYSTSGEDTNLAMFHYGNALWKRKGSYFITPWGTAVRNADDRHFSDSQGVTAISRKWDVAHSHQEVQSGEGAKDQRYKQLPFINHSELKRPADFYLFFCVISIPYMAL